MEKDNAIILILLILIAMASCVCIIVTGSEVALTNPHETNTSDLANMTTNNTNLNNTTQSVDIDNTERDTGIYAPDSYEATSSDYDSGYSNQYQYSYTPSQSSETPQSDSGQTEQPAQDDSGQSEQPAQDDSGQSEQPAETTEG